MAYSVFGIELVIFPALVLYLSYYFGQWRTQPIFCTISYTIGWLIPVLFVGVLPIDVASTFVYRTLSLNFTAPNVTHIPTFVDMYTLGIFWHIFYWMSQLLTWFVLPIMESYAGSGEFTVLRKLRSAFIDNAIIYGSYLVLFICVMVYLLVKRAISFDASSLKVLLITTSNTWGLFLVILFLGYGLVEVPRAVLRAASPISRLRFLYFNLSKRYLEYIEDEEELKIVLSIPSCEATELWRIQAGTPHTPRALVWVILAYRATLEVRFSDDRCARRSLL
uniref:LMBR1 domain-containing protein 2 n=1 Tax=Mesocestoides corti TaxID=53468 RepID=A0A5K3EHE6_MESCO